MAFGAARITVLQMVLAHAVKLAGCGIAAGLLLSLVLARFVTSMLVGVRPADPASLAAASLLLSAAALLAAFAPGWRATHVNPTTALRAE